VTQTLDPAAIQLRGRTKRIAAWRYHAELTASPVQHTLIEELLRAVPPAGQYGLEMNCGWEQFANPTQSHLTARLEANDMPPQVLTRISETAAPH
jgi:hypothetical protein